MARGMTLNSPRMMHPLTPHVHAMFPHIHPHVVDAVLHQHMPVTQNIMPPQPNSPAGGKTPLPAPARNQAVPNVQTPGPPLHLGRKASSAFAGFEGLT